MICLRRYCHAAASFVTHGGCLRCQHDKDIFTPIFCQRTCHACYYSLLRYAYARAQQRYSGARKRRDAMRHAAQMLSAADAILRVLFIWLPPYFFFF